MPGLPVPVAADTCALRCASSVNLSSADAWTPSLARRTRLNGGRARIDARGGVLQPGCVDGSTTRADRRSATARIPAQGEPTGKGRAPGWGNIRAAVRRAFQQPPAISSELALTPGATPPAQVPRRALSFRVSAHHGPRSRTRGRCQRAWRSACRAPRSPGPRQVRPRHSRAARRRARKQSRCASHATADGP